MQTLNKVFLIGRIGQEPKVKKTKFNQYIATFSLATDSYYRNNNGERVQDTEWHHILSWGKIAEFCANYLYKGRLIYIEGKLHKSSWKSENGDLKYKVEVVAHRIQPLDKLKDNFTANKNASNESISKTEDSKVESQYFPSEVSLMDDPPF